MQRARSRTTALLKHIQIPSDISFGIYLREASSFFNLTTFRLKNTKEKMILRSSLLSQIVRLTPSHKILL